MASWSTGRLTALVFIAVVVVVVEVVAGVGVVTLGWANEEMDGTNDKITKRSRGRNNDLLGDATYGVVVVVVVVVDFAPMIRRCILDENKFMK
jgi:hypothetical protein